MPNFLGQINDLENSPFKSILDWPLNQDSNKKIIKLTTIESCLRYIKTILGLGDDDDTLLQLFFIIWEVIKTEYPDLWGENIEEMDDFSKKFMSKVNINALNEFVVDRMDSASSDFTLDIFNPDEVQTYVNSIITSTIPSDFWKREWIGKLQDNSVVRNKIKDSLRKIFQNVRRDKDWDENLQILVEQL